jgi:hypothetical protein
MNTVLLNHRNQLKRLIVNYIMFHTSYEPLLEKMYEMTLKYSDETSDGCNLLLFRDFLVSLVPPVCNASTVLNLPL